LTKNGKLFFWYRLKNLVFEGFMESNDIKETKGLARLLNKVNLRLRPKLIYIFLTINAIPIFLLTIIALLQFTTLGDSLRDIAVQDSKNALNDSSRENLERLTVNLAQSIADFLHHRDQDVLLLASMPRSESVYRNFSEHQRSRIVVPRDWVISDCGMYWVEKEPYMLAEATNVSQNRENNDELYGSAFRNRPPEFFDSYKEFRPLYDEITFIDLQGNEIIKYVNPHSTKIHYPLNPNRVNVSNKLNTYIRSESYFEELQKLGEGEIFVSDVIGAYVGTNYVGMYTPGVMKNVPTTHPNHEKIHQIAELDMEDFLAVARRQSYAGYENPIGQRFEGIIRWGTPVFELGRKIGYVTIALDHRHLMEFVDYVSPMLDRFTILPSPQTGNYAFIWDYQCRSICHPRHNSIVGFNPLSGERQVPWLEGSIAMERDFINGGFLKNEENKTIPILVDGNTTLATDTPFYAWYSHGGNRWLEENLSWEMFNLSKIQTGRYWWEHTAPVSGSDARSWGLFYSEFSGDREMLPRFGERQLRDSEGNAVKDSYGNYILDYQSRSKTPAMALTQRGFVGLDGRYLNNAPQCTGWMNLTDNGGSGSFYILWSGLYKPTTAGAIPYYTGKYHPDNRGGSKRGFAMVTIGAGIDDFTEPARKMEITITDTIKERLFTNIKQLSVTVMLVLLLIMFIAISFSTYITGNINLLLYGLSKFRSGLRHFRLKTDIKDEFGDLANSFDEMADSIVNSESGFIVIIDLDYKILYANEGSMRVWSKVPKEISGHSYATISIYPHDSKYDPILALHEDREAEVLYVSDVDRYYKGSANYLLDKDGEKIGYIISTHDVSEIEEARKRAEQASLVKSTFLANMSHEIRTPMNAILGITEILLQDSKIASELEESLEKIYSSCELLLGIINDILDLSKVEAGKMNLVLSEYDLASMINDTSQLNMMRIGTKLIKFELDIDENLPAKLIGDEIRVKQILNNILSNAFKYTDSGTVSYSITSETDPETGETVLINTVQDTGHGMSPEQVAKVFEAYSRFVDSTKRTIEGTGLGLAITSQLLRLMNGSVHVESEINVGTKVVVKIPQPVVGEEKLGKEVVAGLRTFSSSSKISHRKAKIQREPMPYGKVLVVDDIETNLYVAKGLLSQYKLQIETVMSGQEALDKVSSGSSYDIIFMDHMMPYMDGMEATKLLREGGYSQPIVALTANAVAGQSEIFLQSGFDDFVSKPIDIEKLNIVLNKLLRDKQTPEVLEAARQQFAHEDLNATDDGAKLDPMLIDSFLRDTKKAIEVLEAMESADGYDGEDEIKSYITTVHGTKSSLNNIDEKEYAKVALSLEVAGRERDFATIRAKTKDFIVTLHTLLEKYHKDEEVYSLTEDLEFLKEQLQKIKEFCSDYDRKGAFSIIGGFSEMTKETSELLAMIKDLVNQSEFEEAEEKIDAYLSNIS
jgi:signal transduction histidine kinase/CheY-like chemotaxis protein